MSNEIEIKIKVQVSDPVHDNRHVTKLVFDAILEQLHSIGLVPINEEAYTEKITVECGGIRHIWNIDSDLPFVESGPLSSILRGIARINDSDLMEYNRQAIDAALETLTASQFSRADVVAICIALLESVGGVKDEPSFNQELHGYSINRLCEYETREYSGALGAMLAS